MLESPRLLLRKCSTTRPDEHVELRALTPAKFYCVDIEVALRFNKDNRGRVVGVTEEWADHNEEFMKVK